MTTAVKVDAHAGWPVKVTTFQLNNHGDVTLEQEKIVPANTEETFYVHSHMRIAVEEMPRETQTIKASDVGNVSDVLKP